MIIKLHLKKKILLSIIILITIISVTYQIQIPIKKIKTKFQKKIFSNPRPTSVYTSARFNLLDNYLFAVDLSIGSNKQTFTIILDTGSEILWVPGKEAVSSSGANIYNPSSSKTSKTTSEKVNYEYSSGKITGYYCSDQINFLLPNSFYMHFAVVSSTNLLDYSFDGIMGLARKVNNYKYSVLHTIKNNGGIKSIKFSFKYDYKTEKLYFYLDEDHEDFKSSNVAKSSLKNSEFYGEKLWVCSIVSLGVKEGDKIINQVTFNMDGLFDTGTNNIVFPKKYLSKFENTFANFNCYIREEGDSSTGSQKAIYCRNPNNLPKITIGLQNYVLTLGKSTFYTQIYTNREYVYRLRLLFLDNVNFCVIGQDFFYEYHTLFDGENGVLKFYNDEQNEIAYRPGGESEEGMKTWVIVCIIILGVVIVGAIIAFIIIYFCCWKKDVNYNNILLDKEILEMSSIKKGEDSDDDYDENTETNFNQIMSITSDKKHKAINININTKKE